MHVHTYVCINIYIYKEQETRAFRKCFAVFTVEVIAAQSCASSNTS